jgi:Type II CAAX prenyl endopeptidase Rce1-like
VIAITHTEHTPLGQTSPATLLYGVTIGPIIEEILFRGAAFSVIYVTAASIKGLLRLRLTIAIVLSSLLFALAHTRTMGIPWLVSSEWVRCTRSCGGDPIQPQPQLSCMLRTTQRSRWRCCIVERSDWGHCRLSISHALHIAK